MKIEVIYANKKCNLLMFKEVECGNLFLYKDNLYVKVEFIRNGYVCVNAIRIGNYCEYKIGDYDIVEVLDVEVE